MKIAAFSVLLAFVCLSQGCQYDPNAHLYTTEKPKEADVAGRYTLKDQTVVAGGLTAMKDRTSVIDLQPNGSFCASNIPPRDYGWSDTNFFQALLSTSGKWQVDDVGSIDSGKGPLKKHWGVRLDSTNDQFFSVGLTGKKPPYGLIITIGDPDSGEAMKYEEVK